MDKKIGICLTGGGARGGYQIGALKALEELGWLQKAKAFSGTSIGAANAAVVASRSVDKAHDIWLNLPENNIPKKEHDNNSRFAFNINKGIFSMEVFEDIMVDAIDYDTLRDYEVYATIAEGGEESDGLLELLKRSLKYYIKNETKVHYLPLHEVKDKEIHDGVVASCSVPIVFSPVVMNGKKYYDGGVFDNTPVKPLAEHGCDEIIVIHLHRRRSQVDKKEYPNIVFHEIRHRKGREMGRILRFTDEQTKQLYKYGYEDTMAYFNNLMDNNNTENKNM